MRAQDLAPLAVAIALAACGGTQPAPQVAALAASAAPSAAPAPAASSSKEGAACLDLAEARRVRRTPEPETINVKHVLVKYAGAKRADASVKRSKEEACLRAIEARDKVRGGADFDDVVKEFSEEAGAASRNGAIAGVKRPDVAPPFADAAFELEPNQLSDVVETEFGFHIVLRTP